jgi:hypothetical protein
VGRGRQAKRPNHKIGHGADLDPEFVLMGELTDLEPAVLTGGHDRRRAGGPDLASLRFTGLEAQLLVFGKSHQAASSATAIRLLPVGRHLHETLDAARNTRRGSSITPPLRAMLQES